MIGMGTLINTAAVIAGGLLGLCLKNGLKKRMQEILGEEISRETLYEKVWEGEYFGDSRTLDLHVQRLRRKLGWEDSLVAVYKVGYRLEV